MATSTNIVAAELPTAVPASTEEDETMSQLRQRMAKHPRKARILSEYAVYLRPYDYKAAVAAAEKAVALAPHKPWGYIAQSMITMDPQVRFRYLRQATNVCGSCSVHAFLRVSLQVRLLREPRMLIQQKTRDKNLSRATLTAAEVFLYHGLVHNLDRLYPNSSNGCHNDDTTATLAGLDYQLGLFFRKRRPVDRYAPRAVYHLTRAAKWLTDERRDQARFWLATLVHDQKTNNTVTRCPASYVQELYASFCDDFDSRMVDRLGYRTPQRLRELLDESGAEQIRNAIDLGCGTGLSGMAFRSVVTGCLAGVDLSPEMLQKASERGCYDSLSVGDVNDFLADYGPLQGRLDMILACDVFVYLGDLSTAFSHAFKCLHPGGLFVFSTEHLEDSGHSQSYQLHNCARFAHSRRYVEQLSASEGFVIDTLRKAPIRMNKGNLVVGLLVVLRKPNR